MTPVDRRRAARALALVAVLPLSALAAQAPHAAGRQPAPAQSESPYTGEGPFVIVPARVVSTPVFGMGFMVGLLACAPVALAQDPHWEGKIPEEKRAHLVCGRAVGSAVRWPVYTAVGLPFFIVKKLFWDAPRKINQVAGPPLAKVSRPVVKVLKDWWEEGDETARPKPAPDTKTESAAPWLSP